MDWIGLVGAILGSGALGTIGSAAYFGPKLREAKAKASKAEVDAEGQRQDFLAKRIEDMERLYAQQGEVLDSVRRQLIELADAKQKSDMRVNQLELENQQLRGRISQLEKEVEAYKTLKGR